MDDFDDELNPGGPLGPGGTLRLSVDASDPTTAAGGSGVDDDTMDGNTPIVLNSTRLLDRSTAASDD